MYSVYRVPLYRCSDTITLSARSSRDDAPGGVQPTGTECRQTEAGLVKSWSCTSCAFIPFRCALFPPLRRGGRGGGPGTTSHKVFPMLSPSQSFRIPLARREEPFSLSKAPASPPLPPLRKGGKGIARSRRHSIQRNRNACLEIVPPAQSTPTFHRPSLGASHDRLRPDRLG